MRAIDADALMDDICGAINEMTSIGIMVGGEWLWAKLNDAIENAPTIESERKKGEWNRYYRMHSRDTFICNRCGTCFVVLQGGDKMNLCPNCGADMRGVQDG